MAGRELTVKRVIHASPDEVWAVLSDLEHAPETLRGVTRVEVLEGAGYEVGTRWRETRRIFGKEETQTMEVAECDPPRSTTVTSRSAGVEYRSVFTLEPAEAGTLATICFGASHPDPNLLQRLTATLFGHVGAAVTTRLLNQDLADIAARAERPGSA
jgi:uncharacterized protein YndB with AHSA1/START domain